MQKILYISPNGFLGGAERVVLDLCLGHEKFAKYDACILFFNDGECIEFCNKMKIKSKLLNKSFRLSRPISLLLALIKIRKYIIKEKYKIVHSTMPYSQIVVSLATIGLNIKKVWFQHGPIGGILDKIAVRFSHDFVFFNSNYLRSEHENLKGKKPRIGSKIIPLAINQKESNQRNVALIRKKISSNSIIVGTAGRICELKGFVTFIKAAKYFKDDDKFQFIIIGSANNSTDKAYELKIKELVKKNDLEKKVHFIGFKENIGEYLSAMDIFVHTSIVPESFGLIVGEAMFHKTLVIGSCHGGIKDILINGKTGISFDTISDDAHEILAKIIKESDPRHNKMIDFAKKRIDQYYNLDTMTQAIETAYDQLF